MEKKIKIWVLLASVLVSCGFCSCTNSSEELDYNEVQAEDFIGLDDFKANTYSIIKSLSDLSENYNVTDTRAMEMANDSIDKLVANLTELSANILNKNGIDVVGEFGNAENPRIALVGLALIEYLEYSNVATRASVGGCVLEAIGVKDIYKKGVKAAAKQIVKAGLKKAVPYLGWGLTIADFAHCMMN